ncbi:MAG: galactokinase family protein, partial [Anaerolineales bacterium]
MSTDYPDLIRFKQNILQLCNENHFFNSSKTIYINRTPGRLDLLGGNDDYSGGLVFETTIREATLVGVQERTDEQVFLYNPAVKELGWKDLIRFSLGDLRSDTGVKPLESVRQWINQ